MYFDIMCWSYITKLIISIYLFINISHVGPIRLIQIIIPLTTFPAPGQDEI